MVTEGKSSWLTGLEMVFRLVMVRSSCQSENTFQAKMVAPARASSTRKNHNSRVAAGLLDRYWTPLEKYHRWKLFSCTETENLRFETCHCGKMMDISYSGTMNWGAFCITLQKCCHWFRKKQHFFGTHLNQNKICENEGYHSYISLNISNLPGHSLLAPTGALIVMMVYYIYIQEATFSDFHSVYWCNWCYKWHSK